MQRNTDYLTMFILYVMSTCGKFPILLHWLYICDYKYTVRMEIFVVCEFYSYILIDTEKSLIRENFPVYNIGIVYQDFWYMLDDNLHSKHCYTVAS